VNTGRRTAARILTTVVLVGLGLVVMNLPAILGRQRPGLTVAELNTFTDSVRARPGVAAPDSAALMLALGRVIDPEVDLSVVELGLVESLAVDTAGDARVKLILTTPACPFGPLLARQAVEELKTVSGIRRIEVRLDPSVEWGPERLTDEARKRLREAFGDDGRPGR
jgi:metal-sulfur cluster biosynthetic enzyme